MAELKSRDGEFIGAGMSWKFLKDKIDLAHVRGYAVLFLRATPPDDPDEKAVYNLYQVDSNKAGASSDLYEALKTLYKEYLKITTMPDEASIKAVEALTKAEGK
jgi:hypothetical protein